jgi:predicted transcriptional regulator
MANDSDEETVVRFPARGGKKRSSTEQIWGRRVYQHGYAGVPSILIRAQRRLGLSPTQFNIVIQLLDYWFDPARKPFPTKRDLADRIGVTVKTVQNNIRALENSGLIYREKRRSAAGDWSSNIYHLDGLIQKVQELEPDFTAAREQRRAARARAETPIGKRA